MNLIRWRDPRISLPTLALKLVEEAAEVGGEISDAETKRGHPSEYFYNRALTELTHVELMAGILIERLTKEIEATRTSGS